MDIVDLVKNFFGNCQAKNYKEFVEMLMKSLQDIGVNMSTKAYFLHNYQDKFPDNCSDVSDEQGEWFHQFIETMQEHYEGWWD